LIPGPLDVHTAFPVTASDRPDLPVTETLRPFICEGLLHAGWDLDLRKFTRVWSVIGFLLQRRMRTRAGSCYPCPVRDGRENCKRKRQMMSREQMKGKRLRGEPNGVNHFDDLPDDVLISVLAKCSLSAKYAAEFVNVILTCKRFNALGLHLLVLPQEKVYRELQNLKAMYYPELENLLTALSMKLLQPMVPDSFEKLKHYENTLQRMMAYFHVPKSSIPPRFKEDKVDAFEKQIQAILNSFK